MIIAPFSVLFPFEYQPDLFDFFGIKRRSFFMPSMAGKLIQTHLWDFQIQEREINFKYWSAFVVSVLCAFKFCLLSYYRPYLAEIEK